MSFSNWIINCNLASIFLSIKQILQPETDVC